MTESLAQMDIFFLVTTIAVVIVSLLLVVFLAYAIKVLRDARMITRAIRDELTEITEDIDSFRNNVKDKAERFSGVLGVVTALSMIRKFLKD